jgi:release factor glutamine methyltransferase
MPDTAAAALQAAFVAGLPRSEARSLLAHALQKPTAWLLAHDTDVIELPPAWPGLLARRAAGEPMAYLLGEQAFYDLSFEVTPAVLIPRPETEHLLELALSKAPIEQACDILEIGTGSGCLAVCLAKHRPLARVTAVDISLAALQVAERNALRHGVVVNFLHSDLFAQVQGQFDLIVCNPPYIEAGDQHLLKLKHEPLQALTDAADGLSFYRRFATEAAPFLRPKGWLLIEHGHDQAAAISGLFRAWSVCESYLDLAGHTRGAALQV